MLARMAFIAGGWIEPLTLFSNPSQRLGGTGLGTNCDKPILGGEFGGSIAGITFVRGVNR